MRTYATRAAYGPILVFKFRPNRRQNRSSTTRRYANTPNVSQVRALLIGSIELVSILHDDLNWVDPVTSWISGIDLNNAGLAIVVLFAVTWIAAIVYWKLADVEARYRTVEPAD